MLNIENNKVRIVKPYRKNPKKITGTRFGAILGVNNYKTPFAAWCEITGVYQEPFEGNKYTEAGKILEPRVLADLKERITFGHVKSPYDVYGEKVKHMYDYYPEVDIFGGMWDGIITNDKGEVVSIIEIKTTKSYQEWVDGVPPHYQTQAEVYAKLSGAKYLTFAVVFLTESEDPKKDDYLNLDKVKLVEGENYKIINIPIDKNLGDAIDDRMGYAERFWEDHVLTEISPVMTDTKCDLEIREIIMNEVIDDEDYVGILEEIEQMEAILKSETVVSATKRKKELEDLLRDKLIEKISADDSKESATVRTDNTEFSVKEYTKVVKKFDEKAFKSENKPLWDKYSDDVTTTTYRKSTKVIKDE